MHSIQIYLPSIIHQILKDLTPDWYEQQHIWMNELINLPSPRCSMIAADLSSYKPSFWKVLSVSSKFNDSSIRMFRNDLYMIEIHSVKHTYSAIRMHSTPSSGLHFPLYVQEVIFIVCLWKPIGIGTDGPTMRHLPSWNPDALQIRIDT